MIKTMKLKTLLVIVILFPAVHILFVHTAVANLNFNQLTPNTYEKNEFEDNKDYLHEQSLLERKEPILEEQKELTFMKKEEDPAKRISEQLFKEDNRIKIVTGKAEQMDLFSDPEQGSLFQEDHSEKPIEQNSKLKILYIGLVILAMAIMLVFLIPKMAQGEASK
jgi:type VII secretion protein EssA